MGILEAQIMDLKNSGLKTPSGLYALNPGEVFRAGSLDGKGKGIYAIWYEDKDLWIDLTNLLVVSSLYDLLVLDRRSANTAVYRVGERDRRYGFPNQNIEFTVFTNHFEGSHTHVSKNRQETFATID